MNTTFWEVVATPRGICLSLPVKLLWKLPILFQFSHFQGIYYASIIKKRQHSSLVHLHCNQFTVENWSEQFVRGLEVQGRPSVPEVFTSVASCLWRFSCQARVFWLCSHICMHTFAISLTSFEAARHWWLPNRVRLSIYPLCEKTLSCTKWHKLQHLWSFCCVCFCLVWTFLWQPVLTWCFYNSVPHVWEVRAELPGVRL